jgi:D-alanyl-D-alanine carboxypeptidase/D-alanyl-D-alanine-endopeptidase (penicillin-binding protein 4)
MILAEMHKTSDSVSPNGHRTLLFLLITLLVQLATAPVAGQSHAAVTSKMATADVLPDQSLRGHAHKNRALNKRIEKILDATDAGRGSWGIEVVELKNGKVRYDRDAGRLFIPASNMKMFTTAAALEKLGPEYVIHTTVESDAAPDSQGRVRDLYLVGRGDPNLGVRTFPYIYHGPQQPADGFIQELADQVKARGVREVVHKLVADDSYFVWEPFAPNWAADDLEWGYGAPVSALSFNDNLLTLHVKPGAAAGDRAEVSLSPVADYYLLKNDVLTGAPATKTDYFLERRPGSMELDLWGRIPIDAGDDADTIAIANPPQLLAELFRAALQERGIRVDAPIEVRHLTRLEAASLPVFAPSTPRVELADHTSPVLSEAIKVINKESENLHAEMLLRTLGRVVNQQGSLAGGLAALNAFITQQVGIMPGAIYFSDGSGLSREDLVTPHAAVQLLVYMTRSPYFQAYFDSLPVAGVDGTLVHRFLGDEVKGKIHAKTGSVEHVNTLSGYMDLPSGKRLVFSIMANNDPLTNKQGQDSLDAITLEIYRGFSKHR